MCVCVCLFTNQAPQGCVGWGFLFWSQRWSKCTFLCLDLGIFWVSFIFGRRRFASWIPSSGNLILHTMSPRFRGIQSRGTHQHEHKLANRQQGRVGFARHGNWSRTAGGTVGCWFFLVLAWFHPRGLQRCWGGREVSETVVASVVLCQMGWASYNEEFILIESGGPTCTLCLWLESFMGPPIEPLY